MKQPLRTEAQVLPEKLKAPAITEQTLKEPAARPGDTQKVVGSILAPGSSEAAIRVLAFVATAYLARLLGPTGFGIIGFALALAGYFALAVNQGFLDIGSREIARRPQQVATIAASAIVVRLALAMVAFSGLVVTALFLDKPSEIKLVLVLTGLSTFSLALDTSWAYKGLERNRVVAVALVIGHALYLCTVLAIVRGPGDVMFVPLAMFLGEMSAAILLAGLLFQIGDLKLDIGLGWHMLRTSLVPTLSLVFRSFIFTFDVVLLGFLMGEKEVGLYSAPYRICFLIMAIAVAIRTSYLPAVTRALLSGKKSLAETAGRSIEMASAVGMPAVIGGIVLAEPLLSAIFGAEYMEGAAAFRLLLLSIGFIFIYVSIHNLFVVCDRLKLEMLIIACAATINLALNLILIPRYGLEGAAVSTVVSEGFILLAGVYTIYRLGIRVSLWPVARTLLPALLMGGILLALAPINLGLYPGLIVSIALGSIFYAAAMLAFRNVPQDLAPHLDYLGAFVRRLKKDPQGV